MKKTLPTILPLLLIVGCSNYRLLLNSPDSFVLLKDNEKIEISDKQEILVEWVDNNQHFITSAMFQKSDKSMISKRIETPITVNIVEVNDDVIRLGSHAWKTREDLPPKYLELGSELNIIGSKKPTLLFPWKQIRTIYIYDRKFTKDDLFDSPKYILIGAATGAAMLTSKLISDAYSDKRELGYTDFDESRIISSGLTGALLGAIVYPIYTYFDISFGIGTGENIKEHSKMYPINQIGLDYKIEIKN